MAALRCAQHEVGATDYALSLYTAWSDLNRPLGKHYREYPGRILYQNCTPAKPSCKLRRAEPSNNRAPAEMSKEAGR